MSFRPVTAFLGVGLALATAGLLATDSDARERIRDFGSSFLDVDYDQRFTPGVDIPLAHLLGPDDNFFRASMVGPNWTPLPTPVGIVLQGNVKLIDGLFLEADHIRVRGKVTGFADENITLWADDALIVEPRARIANLGLIRLRGSNLAQIGDRAKLVGKDYGFISFGSYSLTRIGDNVKLQALNRARDPDMYVWSNGQIEIGSGLKFKGGELSVFTISAEAGNVELERFNFRGGQLYVAAGGEPGEAFQISMKRSSFSAKNKDFGFVQMWTSRGPGGVRPPDAITLDKTRFQVAFCEFFPDIPPVRGCAAQY